MKKIGIRILGCMALLSMVGCGRIEGASVQDLSNTKDAIVESETTLAENNNEYSNKNSLFYSDISSYEIFTDVNSEAALKNLYYNIDDFIDSDSSDVIVKGNIIEIEYVYIDGFLILCLPLMWREHIKARCRKPSLCMRMEDILG